MNAIYPYADPGSWAQNSLGQVVKQYFEAFVYQLENTYLPKYGDDGKNTFNQVVTTKVITFEVDDDNEFSYCGTDVKEGKFRIIAKGGYLGTNVSDACTNMLKAIEKAEEAAGGAKLSVGAKANVKETVEKEFPAVEKQFAELVGEKVTLDANLEENFAIMKKQSGFNDGYFGTVTLDYFKSFANNLEYLKFKTDDMMQEAFQEACSEKVIRLEVVEKLQHGYYNDVIFEEGVCKLQVCVTLVCAYDRLCPDIGGPISPILAGKLSIGFSGIEASERTVSASIFQFETVFKT
jgi:hypothetical protein